MQEAPVKQFRGEYNFLSNFHPCRVKIMHEGKVYYFPSAEHAFMFHKAPDNPAWLQTCLDSRVTPADIKRLGRKVKITQPDWMNYRKEAMLKVVYAKFRYNPELASKLLNTKGEIKEGNNWGDVYWGVDINTGEGENNLGKILMQVREMLLSN
jgi:ribA/ribD-fused uncharacterized protein